MSDGGGGSGTVGDQASRLGHLPSRSGTTLVMQDDRLVAHLTRTLARCRRGATSMASVVLVVDARTDYPDGRRSWAIASCSRPMSQVTAPMASSGARPQSATSRS